MENKKNNAWTEEDIEFLKANYGKMKAKEIAKAIGRTEGAVMTRAYLLGLNSELEKVPTWTGEDIEFLKANYGKMTNDEIAKAIGRTERAVRDWLHRLGLSRQARWTDEEIAYLKENFLKAKRKEITDAISRHTWKGILLKASSLCLIKPNAWTEEEDNFIKANYEKMTYAEIAKAIGRSEGAVLYRAIKLGIRSCHKPVKETKPKPVKETKPKAVPKSILEELTPRHTHKAEDYGPYDPATHCCECKNYRPNPGACGCWHVKGANGNYKLVRPHSPACRYFVD